MRPRCAQGHRRPLRESAILAGQPHCLWWCPEPDLNRHGPQGQRGLSSSCLHSTIRAPAPGTRAGHAERAGSYPRVQVEPIQRQAPNCGASARCCLILWAPDDVSVPRPPHRRAARSTSQAPEMTESRRPDTGFRVSRCAAEGVPERPAPVRVALRVPVGASFRVPVRGPALAPFGTCSPLPVHAPDTFPPRSPRAPDSGLRAASYPGMTRRTGRTSEGWPRYGHPG